MTEGIIQKVFTKYIEEHKTKTTNNIYLKRIDITKPITLETITTIQEELIAEIRKEKQQFENRGGWFYYVSLKTLIGDNKE